MTWSGPVLGAVPAVVRALARRYATLALVMAASFPLQAAPIDVARLPSTLGKPVDFTKDVLPLLRARCFECHGADKQKSGFRLDLRSPALKGGDNGIDILPGNSAGSPLIHYVARLVPDMEMPPKGPALTPDEVGLLRAWIDQGAAWNKVDSGAKSVDPLDWWSLRPLAPADPPSVPTAAEGWKQNPIDAFIFAKLQESGLSPSAPADRRTLIRRATYDLHGLPPTPGEVDAFLLDTRIDAYERLIDRLLASPRYGEQWGRHWLDVIRFGESRGYERNEIINTAWPFRDYIVQSFNQDKPFDQLTLEHLAGDVIGRDDPAVEIGAAYLVAGPYDDVGNQDAAQARIIRANTVDEIITTTGAAFLGLTVGCARCHNHKFDPILAEDYYRFYAVFAGVNHAERTWCTSAQRRQRELQLEPLEAQQRVAKAALKSFEQLLQARATNQPGVIPAYPLPPIDPHLTEDRFEPIEAKYVRLSILSNNREPRHAGGVHLDEFEVWTAEATSRNVALASLGGQAAGPSRRPDDFAEAYGPAQVIDGQYGARWIVDGPAQLTITLARPERIDRVRFSADRFKSLPTESGEITFVGEYQIEVSMDGAGWSKVADSHNRAPLNEQFAQERLLNRVLTAQDREERERLERAVAESSAQVNHVPALPVAWIGRNEQPKEPCYVMKGGDPAKKGPEVRPGSLSTLARALEGFELSTDAPEGERRLALARWLVRKDNPLTARVLANRLWQYHFGEGIVDTPSDFGKLGGTPSHPELLDWLAHRLHQEEWHLKALHREIMLSQTYRQSGAWREAAAKVDAGARLLWRYPPRRLSAEEIRDTMLSVAGVLDPRMGGPGFKLYRYLQDNVATYLPLDNPGPDTYRRAIYHHSARASRLDLISDFDGPDCAFAAPHRGATTSPLQALTLLNHRFTLDMAEALARRLEREAREVPKQVEVGFELACGRSPQREETDASVQFCRAHGTVAFCRALLNLSEMIYVE